MARKVFFSFHYRDIWKVNQVRHANKAEGVTSAGFIDGSIWEEAKKKGEATIKRMIDNSLEGTTVTAVLIGPYTAGREYINYEIIESYKRKNGLLGIYLHNLRDKNQNKEFVLGTNPFDNIWLPQQDGGKKYFSEFITTYDWVINEGYTNFGDWIETAYKQMNPPKYVTPFNY